MLRILIKVQQNSSWKLSLAKLSLNLFSLNSYFLLFISLNKLGTHADFTLIFSSDNFCQAWPNRFSSVPLFFSALSPPSENKSWLVLMNFPSMAWLLFKSSKKSSKILKSWNKERYTDIQRDIAISYFLCPTCVKGVSIKL